MGGSQGTAAAPFFGGKKPLLEVGRLGKILWMVPASTSLCQKAWVRDPFSKSNHQPWQPWAASTGEAAVNPDASVCPTPKSSFRADTRKKHSEVCWYVCIRLCLLLRCSTLLALLGWWLNPFQVYIYIRIFSKGHAIRGRCDSDLFWLRLIFSSLRHPMHKSNLSDSTSEVLLVEHTGKQDLFAIISPKV